jgi:hypothetical protein
LRYSILLPKLKATAMFQPEDHVSQQHIQWPGNRGRMSQWALSGMHTGSIFFSGTLLFVAQERMLRYIEPSTHGEFARASP